MNTQIDLNAFRRGAAPATTDSPAGTPALVSPPRRVFTRYVVPFVLLAGFASVGAYSMRGSLVRPVAVDVVMPVVGETASPVAGGTVLFRAPGWVEPYPLPTMISSRTAGTVKAIHVLEGQRVDAGTLIAELVDTDAVLEVQRAEAHLALKRAEYEAAREAWANPTSLVEAARTAEATAQQLRAEKEKLRQMLAIAKRQAYIDTTLSSTGAGAGFPALKAEWEARAAEAAIAETEAKIQVNDATLSAAKERLRLRTDDKLKVGVAKAEYDSAVVALEQARYNLSLRRIDSPASGTIMRLYASPGSMVSMEMKDGNLVAAVYDPSNLQVRAEAPLADAAKIRDGLLAEMQFEALPDKVFHGRLERVVHEFDIQRNTLPVKVRVLDPDPALKPEMIGSLQFKAPVTAAEQADTSATLSVTMVPSSLVPPGASEARLWLVGADMTARQRQVRLGPERRGGLREVVSGVTPADKIIAQPPPGLTEGRRVAISIGKEGSHHAD